MTLLASVQAGEATTMMNGILGPVMPNDYKTKLIFLEKLDENVKRRGVLILIASERAGGYGKKKLLTKWVVSNCHMASKLIRLESG